MFVTSLCTTFISCWLFLMYCSGFDIICICLKAHSTPISIQPKTHLISNNIFYLYMPEIGCECEPHWSTLRFNTFILRCQSSWLELNRIAYLHGIICLAWKSNFIKTAGSETATCCHITCQTNNWHVVWWIHYLNNLPTLQKPIRVHNLTSMNECLVFNRPNLMIHKIYLKCITYVSP